MQITGNLNDEYCVIMSMISRHEFLFRNVYYVFVHLQTIYTYFFRKVVNQMLKVRIVFLLRNKKSFLTLMTSRILLVIWMVLIWTGSMKANHFSQKRKTLKIPSHETLLGESENINDYKKPK